MTVCINPPLKAVNAQSLDEDHLQTAYRLACLGPVVPNADAERVHLLLPALDGRPKELGLR